MASRTLALALAVAVTTPALGVPVRLFAVGHKQRLTDALTYTAYHDKMAALMDASFPGRAGLVQAGVDDVASHLTGSDLVVFPEDVGLVAAFIGTRGAPARAAIDSGSAILTLYGSYGPIVAHYQAKFPGQPIIRYLGMAITDTLYRSFFETFRELAMTHGVYLAACANIAPAHRVEVADDAALVTLLRDPDEPTRTYAYEATSPFVYNATYVFAPNGEVLVPDGNGGTLESPSQTGGAIRGTANKPYLTPIEQPPPGSAASLMLAFGPVRDVDVIATPVGRIGIVISKDAWMIDVNDRLVARGANLVLQPEAFSAWGYVAAPWEPDIFKQGGFNNLQKNPGVVANVNASMTGNLFEITFDGQTAIIGRKQKVAPGPLTERSAWIGQNPEPALLAVTPWIVPDPGIGNPFLSLAERRGLLDDAGALLLPGSGVACLGPLDAGACENGYREAVVWADVDVPNGPVTAAVDPVRETPPAFEASVLVSGAEPAPTDQHAPRIVAKGQNVLVVWHETMPSGLPNVFLAMSRDGGRSFAAPIRVSDHDAGTVAELYPQIALRGNRVAIVWQEFASGLDDDEGRIRLARFTLRGAKRGGDIRVDDHDGSGKWLPTVAFAGPNPVVGWIDERDSGPEGLPFEHVYAATSTGGGTAFNAASRVDAGTPVPLAVHLGHTWAPAIATTPTSIQVVWVDFRDYQWDVYSARADTSGAAWTPNLRLDDSTILERLNQQPAIAIARDGTPHVAWSDQRAREADTNIFYTRSADRGGVFATPRRLDDSDRGFDPNVGNPSNQWSPTLAVDHDRVFAAWQDDRLGNNDVFFTSSDDGGITWASAERVDDTGMGVSSQSRPHMAIGGRGKRRRCFVAWEDDRGGTSDIYLGRRKCG